SESRQVSSTSQSRLHLFYEPPIEHLVQVNVREDRRDYSALWHSGGRMVDAPFRHHARLHPLADETKQHSVSHPLAQYLSHLRAIHRPEEVFDVCFKHPAPSEVHCLLPHGSQCLMRRPPRSEAIRAVQEVLLVDGLQHH